MNRTSLADVSTGECTLCRHDLFTHLRGDFAEPERCSESCWCPGYTEQELSLREQGMALLQSHETPNNRHVLVWPTRALVTTKPFYNDYAVTVCVPNYDFWASSAVLFDLKADYQSHFRAIFPVRVLHSVTDHFKPGGRLYLYAVDRTDEDAVLAMLRAWR